MPVDPELAAAVGPVSSGWSGGLLAAVLGWEGVGSKTALALARAFPDPADFDPAALELPGTLRLPNHLPVPVVAPAGVTLVGFFDDDYPDPLATIADPPPVLWVRGQWPPPVSLLAVVGTRNPSSLGVRAAHVAAHTAVGAGLGVVSGLALGCDTIAHVAALDAGGYTAAVLGSPVTSPTPEANWALVRRILDSDGMLISEVAPGTLVSAQSLVRRNRIQSGLSVGVVVAESGLPGGSMHTARFALEQGRRLIVPLPSGRDGPSGNVALTSTDPDLDVRRVLQSTRHLADRVGLRRPLADDCPGSGAELAQAVRRLAAN